MIYFDDRQDKIKLEDKLLKTIEELVNCALEEEKVNMDFEISMIFVDNESIREINREFRNIDKATDVLSFPMLDYPKGRVFKDAYAGYEFQEADLDEGRLVLGDMALSLERAEEQRIEYNHSFEREACYLVVHSVLHLLGYDHMEEEEKSIMRKREEEILRRFDLAR